MSPPQTRCICSDGSPMSPALTASVLHGAGPALSAPAVARRPEGRPWVPACRLLSSPPPTPDPSHPTVRVRPSLHGGDSSTSGSVYSLSPPTASALWEQQIVSFGVWWFSVLFSSVSRTVRCHGWVPAPSEPGPEHMCSQHSGKNTPVTVLNARSQQWSALLLSPGDLKTSQQPPEEVLS